MHRLGFGIEIFEIYSPYLYRMKTVGQKAILLQSGILAAVIAIMVFKTGFFIPLIVVLAVAVARLLTSPIVRITPTTISVTTLLPVTKTMTVQLQDVERIYFNTAFASMKFAIALKDGSTYTKTTSYNTINQEPIYNALQETGLPVERNGSSIS